MDGTVPEHSAAPSSLQRVANVWNEARLVDEEKMKVSTFFVVGVLASALLTGLFALHVFSLDRWKLYPEIWTVRDAATQNRADCMVQLYQVHSDGVSASLHRDASQRFGVSLERMIYAEALPAAHFAIEPDPSFVTLTFVTDCARKRQAASLLSDYHALIHKGAPRFQVLPGPTQLSDTAMPATGPAWSDGEG